MKIASKILLIQNMFFEFGAGLFGPIYAIFVEQIGGSILDAGIAWGIFLISIGLSEYIVSKFIDRFKQKNILIITSVIYAFVIFSYILVSNVYELFVLQLIAGIVIAIDKPAWSSWYAQLQRKGERGHDFALMYMSNDIAKGIAILFGASLAYLFGFKILFILAGLFILLGIPFIVKAEKSQIKIKRRYSLGIRKLPRKYK
jgi:MFS family permease